MTRRILVVDDEPDIRELARLALAHVAGWDVLTASGGEEALRTARAERLDAVVLDVMMPGMDGPQTARRLAADPVTADVPVLLLTARVLSSDRAELEETPVAGVLAKPFDPMTLADQVRDCLGWSR
ncbi:response regulator [Actinotalea sp. AC32]|nr:response regulator [Actinotalea sp. AC32]